MTRRIAIVTHSLDLGGGAATMTSYLYRVLNERPGYRAEVISLAQASSDTVSTRLSQPGSWRRGPQVEQRQWREIPYLHVGCEYAEYEPARYRPRPVLTDLLNRYDLVQVAAGTPPWAAACFAARPPVLLWTATTLMADRVSRLNELPFGRRQLLTAMARRSEVAEREAIRRSSLVFGLSPYAVDAVKAMVPGVPVELAICGIDTERFRPMERPTRDFIVAVARFSDARKNVGLLLRAYRRLLELAPGAPDLCLVGEPPNASMLAHLKELGLEGRVRVNGPAAPSALADLYANALCTVLSSDEEGLGLVLVEGMACGLPAISTRSGGPELVIRDGETGYLTPLGEVEPLARALERVVSDREMAARMGRAARVDAVERFSLAATSAPFFDAYDRILGAMTIPHAAYAS